MKRREFLKAALAGTLASVIPALPAQLGEGPGGRRKRDVVKQVGQVFLDGASRGVDWIPEGMVNLERPWMTSFLETLYVKGITVVETP